MSIYVTEELKHEIKTTCTLVKVVSKYILLEKDGANYKGQCPFHKEKTGSFTIFPPSNDNPYETFFCFGCHVGDRKETNIGNNVIEFIMAIEKLDYYEACQFLCDNYGINYQEYNANPELVKLKKRKTEENISYYNNLINNKMVLGYLSDRGITSESIKKFRLGLTPPNEYAGWKKNRLVFGITDTTYDPVKANTIGLAYRSLQGQIEASDGMEYFPNDTPTIKYRNDAESLIFDKGKVLYGFNYASKHIRSTGYATVVEGYMDVILMHQAGYENTVAPMGTSFTEAQMDLLKKYCSKILFFLDGDSSGLEAMKRTLPKLLEKGFSVLVVEAPNGQDPADLVLSFSQDKGRINNYIKNNSIPALQWFMESHMRLYDSAVHKARMDALESVLPLLDKVSHRESKISYATMIANRLNIEASSLILTGPNMTQTTTPVVITSKENQLPKPNIIQGWVNTKEQKGAQNVK